MVRSGLPTVMDAQVGLGIASPQPAAAAVVPSMAPLARPDLAAQMETAVADLPWSPQPRQYDDRGLVKHAGELTSLFLALAARWGRQLRRRLGWRLEQEPRYGPPLARPAAAVRKGS